MVQAWFMDESTEDQRLQHHRNPPKHVTLDEVKVLTGVEYFKLQQDEPANDPLLKELRHQRGYSFQDQITCSEECLPNYKESLRKFYTEHLHTDEEIRLVLEGSGYFDVRDKNDAWIRIFVEKGDLIIIPAGIYHRFTMDEKNYIRAMRLFVGEPRWIAYDRPADDMDCRKEYMNALNSGQFSKAKMSLH